MSESCLHFRGADLNSRETEMYQTININEWNQQEKSRSDSHRNETPTKTNYENKEYIYLIGYVIASILPPIHEDD